MIKLDIETVIIIPFYIFKKQTKRLNMFEGNMEDIKNIQIKLLEMKTMSEIRLLEDYTE